MAASLLKTSVFLPGTKAFAQKASACRPKMAVSAKAAVEFDCAKDDEECIAGWFDDWRSKRAGGNSSRANFFVGGNWKANGNAASIDKLVEQLNEQASAIPDNVEAVCSPPYIYLQQVEESLSPLIQVAAQNCWTGPGGAYTGEITAEMLLDKNIPWVITGHSERRALLGETSEFVAEKTAYAVRNGLCVMACIGETLEEREAGRTVDVCKEQLAALVSELEVFEWASVVVAYEPVWAIGTGKVATPEQAQETHKAIRDYLEDAVSPAVAERTRILYGGSVKSSNAGELAGQPDIDGFLVGGASLDGGEFAAICAAGEVKAEVK